MSSISSAGGAVATSNQTVEVFDAFEELDICAGHRTSSREDFGAMGGALSGQPQDPEIQLPGSGPSR